MPLYVTYTTKEELAEYLFVEVEDLPKDVDRWLSRASDLVVQATFNNLDIYNESHMDAVTKAVCAQVEYWMTAGEDKNITGHIKSYSLDDLSVTLDETKDTGYLCVRAIGYLNSVGLLYRGV